MTVLFVFPHPDDESIFAGGTIARHIANGDKVIWICAGYGERSGSSDKRSSYIFYFLYCLLGFFSFLVYTQRLIIWWLSIFRRQNQQLMNTRKKEAEKVSCVYGMTKLHFLGIEDMKFDKFNSLIENEFRNFLELYKPEIIYTCHPNGITDHIDHRTLTKSILKAVKTLPNDKRAKLYGATIPSETIRKHSLPFLGSSGINLLINLSNKELNQKISCINTYKSQSYLWKIFLEKYPKLLEKEYFIELI